MKSPFKLLNLHTPNEYLYNIVIFLPLKDIIKMRLVCSRYDNYLSTSFWKNINVNKYYLYEYLFFVKKYVERAFIVFARDKIHDKTNTFRSTMCAMYSPFIINHQMTHLAHVSNINIITQQDIEQILSSNDKTIDKYSIPHLHELIFNQQSRFDAHNDNNFIEIIKCNYVGLDYLIKFLTDIINDNLVHLFDQLNQSFDPNSHFYNPCGSECMLCDECDCSCMCHNVDIHIFDK